MTEFDPDEFQSEKNAWTLWGLAVGGVVGIALVLAEWLSLLP